MTSKACRSVFFSAAAVASTIGCGGPGYQLAPVSGVVRVDGEPLTGGRISFSPKSTGDSVKSGKPAFGDIKTDGSFVLSTYGTEDGAVVGRHRITLINSDPDSQAGKQLRAKRVRVQGYFEIVADTDNQIDVDISSADIAKYGQR